MGVSRRKRIRIYRFLQVRLPPYSLYLTFLLPRHSDYRYYDEKTIPFAITGDPISSRSPRLITSRTARNGAKFFDRPFSRISFPRNLLEPLPNDSSRTLYSRSERSVFLPCSKRELYALGEVDQRRARKSTMYAKIPLQFLF